MTLYTNDFYTQIVRFSVMIAIYIDTYIHTHAFNELQFILMYLDYIHNMN